MVFPKKSAATTWSTECNQSNLKIRFDTPCTLKMGEIFLPSSFCLCMNSKVLSRWCLHSAVVSASATCRQEGNPQDTYCWAHQLKCGVQYSLNYMAEAGVQEADEVLEAVGDQLLHEGRRGAAAHLGRRIPQVSCTVRLRACNSKLTNADVLARMFFHRKPRLSKVAC